MEFHTFMELGFSGGCDKKPPCWYNCSAICTYWFVQSLAIPVTTISMPPSAFMNYVDLNRHLIRMSLSQYSSLNTRSSFHWCCSLQSHEALVACWLALGVCLTVSCYYNIQDSKINSLNHDFHCNYSGL